MYLIIDFIKIKNEYLSIFYHQKPSNFPKAQFGDYIKKIACLLLIILLKINNILIYFFRSFIWQ
jgi:hypothetical protein